jgi:hypothetical protein
MRAKVLYSTRGREVVKRWPFNTRRYRAKLRLEINNLLEKVQVKPAKVAQLLMCNLDIHQEVRLRDNLKRVVRLNHAKRNVHR